MPTNAVCSVLPVYLIHYCRPDWLLGSVESILRSERVAIDLAVVDNGGLGGALRTLPTATRLLRPGRNRGFAGGANIAIADFRSRYPQSRYLVVGSHDLHVEPDTFRLLLDAAGDNPRLGILAPLIDGRTHRLSQGTASPSTVQETPWVSGACMLITRACLDDVDRFDERFGSYLEDVEICGRATRAGWMVGVGLQSHARGLGTAHTRERDMLMASNAVLLALMTGGPWKGLGQLFRLVAQAARHAVGGMIPGRPAGARLASREMAKATIAAIRRAVTQITNGNWRQTRIHRGASPTLK